MRQQWEERRQKKMEMVSNVKEHLASLDTLAADDMRLMLEVIRDNPYRVLLPDEQIVIAKHWFHDQTGNEMFLEAPGSCVGRSEREDCHYSASHVGDATQALGEQIRKWLPHAVDPFGLGQAIEQAVNSSFYRESEATWEKARVAWEEEMKEYDWMHADPAYRSEKQKQWAEEASANNSPDDNWHRLKDARVWVNQRLKSIREAPFPPADAPDHYEQCEARSTECTKKEIVVLLGLAQECRQAGEEDRLAAVHTNLGDILMTGNPLRRSGQWGSRLGYLDPDRDPYTGYERLGKAVEEMFHASTNTEVNSAQLTDKEVLDALQSPSELPSPQEPSSGR